MYKLLIVEDEKWEREGLTRFLNWSELGIEIVGMAANGAQGLKMAREHLPNIILTDIKMPKMDGLEMSKKVKNLLPDCHIIIVTGYDDFEYAQDAIQFEVCEYLLKPIQKTPLLDAITRTIKSIRQAGNRTEYMQNLKVQITEQMHVEREKFLLHVIGETPYQLASVVDIPIDQSFFQQNLAAIVLKYDINSYYMNEDHYEMRIKFRDIYRYVCRAVYMDGIVAQDVDGRYEIIICMSINDPEQSCIQEVIQRIKKAGKEPDVPKWVAGVGSYVKSIAGFVRSYNEAKTALDRAFFLRDAEVVFYKDLNIKDEDDAFRMREFFMNTADYSKRILNSVITADPQDIIRLSESLFEYIYNSSVKRSFVCNYFLSLLNELSVLALSVDGCAYSMHRLNEDKLMDRFIKLEDLKEWFHALLMEVNRSMLIVRKNREKQMVAKVMNYIINHHNTDLGMDAIASDMGFSPSYLGGLFKQHTGRGFSETLTDYRVKKAEKLLTAQAGSIMEIAKAVGFASASYFSTVFKKTHDITPMEFQKIQSNGGGENL